MQKKPFKALQVILKRKLEDEGWNNVSTFATKSGVQYSSETVRRAFNDTEIGKKIEPATIADIMYFLGFNPQEIRSALEEYTDDRSLCKIIGDREVAMTTYEVAALGALRELHKGNQRVYTHVANFLDALSESMDTNIKFFTDQLRRKE